MKKLYLMIGLLFLIENSVFAFYPAHVQICTANLVDGGQGSDYEMMVNYEESKDGNISCNVAYYYGYEYGSETGYRGMFQIYPLSTSGLKCTVEGDGLDKRLYIHVAKKDKEGKVANLVKRCLMTKGGDKSR